jgi:SAM-dependent methyltransferase
MVVSAREGYRAWASTYDDGANPVTSLLNRHLEEFVGDTRGKRVVDVGCGTGRWVSRFGGVGLDLSWEMLARCSGSVVHGDARALPFRDGCADIVLCALMLGYVWPVGDVMREMARVARSGGCVIGADLCPGVGWRRTFGSRGEGIEIENREYALAELEVEGLRFEDSRELFLGDEERRIYEGAGRMDLFERVKENPVLWMRRWRR